MYFKVMEIQELLAFKGVLVCDVFYINLISVFQHLLISYNNVSYHDILYYIILYHIEYHYIALYYITPHHTTPHHITFCDVISSYISLHYNQS